MMKANFKETKTVFNGKEIVVPRGSMITGRFALSLETGITPGTVYDKLRLLQNVRFLNIKSNNRFSVITLLKYEVFQSVKTKRTATPTTSQQPANNQPTTSQHILSKVSKESKVKKERVFSPPSLKDIEEYIKEKNYNIDAERFYDFFTVANWVDSKGHKVKNWKQKLITWSSYNNEDQSTNKKGEKWEL